MLTLERRSSTDSQQEEHELERQWLAPSGSHAQRRVVNVGVAGETPKDVWEITPVGKQHPTVTVTLPAVSPAESNSGSILNRTWAAATAAVPVQSRFGSPKPSNARLSRPIRCSMIQPLPLEPTKLHRRRREARRRKTIRRELNSLAPPPVSSLRTSENSANSSITTADDGFRKSSVRHGSDRQSYSRQPSASSTSVTMIKEFADQGDSMLPPLLPRQRAESVAMRVARASAAVRIRAYKAKMLKTTMHGGVSTRVTASTYSCFGSSHFGSDRQSYTMLRR